VISSDGGTTVVELPEFDGVRVPMKLRETAPNSGAALALGVRPEHFEPGGEVKIRTQIDVIEDLGGVAYAYARSAEETPLVIQQRNARGLREDTVLATGFDPERAFLFDRQSGRRIR
jgi:lactose/L-arabinose transport system ATP-binding protein